MRGYHLGGVRVKEGGTTRESTKTWKHDREGFMDKQVFMGNSKLWEILPMDRPRKRHRTISADPGLGSPSIWGHVHKSVKVMERWGGGGFGGNTIPLSCRVIGAGETYQKVRARKEQAGNQRSEKYKRMGLPRRAIGSLCQGEIKKEGGRKVRWTSMKGKNGSSKIQEPYNL